MLTLGIETSCDETAVALVRDRKVLAEMLASSMDLHAPFGGVVPEIASRAHTEAVTPLIDAVLKRANVPLKKIDLIACTGGPGLLGSVLVGVSAAKALALTLKKPIVFVDHVLAHAYAGAWVAGASASARYPFVALVVSGGHTLLIHWKKAGHIELIGKTMDDAAGEAFDKVGKMLGLGYPGGPVIDRISRGVDPGEFIFPRSQINEKHFDFSFSGIKTSVYYRVAALEKNGPLTDSVRAGVAAGFQEAVVEVLTAKAIRACRELKVKRLVVGGGVSANSRLQQAIGEAAKREGVQVIFPGGKLSVDNAVMIAALGQEMARVKSPRLGKPHRGAAALSFEPYSDFFGKKYFYTHSRKRGLK
ncbi:MAG: tRNA (adenosine(37)-N6)-threonylcarbamoyltransferase complex transferase subunit TsaD [Candidatus Omnitrophica bacterium]|nr:tRNA (adenosine(37)-N6)-threonylcarbamoyltransferase complex transferase subunit TsaD [Candidatus Omnitrophota bacterium]